MIAEALLYATAMTGSALRRRGLVGDAVALWSRATRQRRAWAHHEARCRAFVQGCLEGLPHRRTAIVLGSGLLRDTPAADLARALERVVLVDAVHLWPARRLARRLGCETVVADLVGHAADDRRTPASLPCPPPCGEGGLGEAEPARGRSAAPTASTTVPDGRSRSALPSPQGGEQSLPNPSPRADAVAALAQDERVDLVISANVLSQLPMSLVRGLPAGEAAESAARDILRRHLDDLAKFPGRVCLLSDVAYRDVDPEGRVIEETDLMHGLALPPPDEAWDWTVAPRGEIDRDFARIHRVQAWRDFRGGAD